jgi:transcriptional regulator with PAS, ATPase and Fis domain
MNPHSVVAEAVERTEPSQLSLPHLPKESASPDAHLTSMERLMVVAARVAPVDSTVLILGESGVGKERMARWLHDASRRNRRPFVAVNCGAFSESILESELFGHTRGAFTGATTDRLGVFEAAHGGTLFLDEVGEVSPSMQTKLLRVLQQREVSRVGETRSRSIDVRLIAATNRDLPAEVKAQRFRLDLYYRLHVIELRIPPLRERPEELRELIGTLLSRTARRMERPIAGITQAALDALLRHTWPGNIRELEHAIEAACAISAGPEIDLADLPDAVNRAQAAAPLESLRAREGALVRTVLARNGGDRRRTARELGISLSTLKRRIGRSNP